MSKQLLEELEYRGYLEYGTIVPAKVIREILDIEMPEVGTKAQFDAIALQELAAVDYVRKHLIKTGKYFGGHHGDYRVFLPSENKRQVEAYMNQADGKLQRAIWLSRSTPVEAHKFDSDLHVRLVMKRESVRDRGISARPKH